MKYSFNKQTKFEPQDWRIINFCERLCKISCLHDICVRTRDAENLLEILKNFSLFSEKRGDQMQDLINKFETLLTRDKVEKCKQVKITSYFVKEK